MDQQKSKSYLAPSRVGKKQISGFFDTKFVMEIKILAARTGESIESLLFEALTDLLAKKNK